MPKPDDYFDDIPAPRYRTYDEIRDDCEAWLKRKWDCLPRELAIAAQNHIVSMKQGPPDYHKLMDLKTRMKALYPYAI